MALTQRYLITLVVFLAGAVVSISLYAQEPSKPPVTFRVIAVGNSVSALLYQASPGRVVPVSAGGTDLSQSYVSPTDGVLSFYREIPSSTPGEKPHRVPITEAHLGKGGPYLVVMISSPSADSSGGVKTQALVLDDSWEAHPLQTVRVLNFSQRRATLQLGSETQELPTAGTHITPYPPGKGSIRFKAALMEESGWVLRSTCPQGIIPNTRSTLVITDVAPTKDEPRPVDINVANLFDFSKPPADTSPRRL